MDRLVQWRASRRVVTSFNNVVLGEDARMGDHDACDYVFEVEQTCDGTSVVASLSSQQLGVYDVNTLSTKASLPVHSDRINSLELSRTDPFLALTASSDKSVCLWDLRIASGATTGAQITITCPDEAQSASCGGDGSLLAVACGSSVNFYDLRHAHVQSSSSGSSGGSSSSSSSSGKAKAASAKLGAYADVHTDMITQVKFHPEQPMHLVSAAEDGLICLSNTAVQAEEEAVVSILNTECPVRRFGFFGPGSEGLYCLSTTETASFWHCTSAQRVGNFPTIRAHLGVEYLVDCIYDGTNDSLLLLAGDYEGKALLASAQPTEINPVAMLQHSGHVATIRCARALVGTNGSKIITGAEDARLCLWEPQSSSGGGGEKDSAATGATSTSSSKKASTSLRFAPY